MPTNEQSIIQAKEKIEQLKSEYYDAFKAFNAKGSITLDDVLSVHRMALKYFNYVEDFVASSDLLGAHKSEIWSAGFGEDCYTILETVALHYEFIQSK